MGWKYFSWPFTYNPESGTFLTSFVNGLLKEIKNYLICYNRTAIDARINQNTFHALQNIALCFLFIVDRQNNRIRNLECPYTFHCHFVKTSTRLSSSSQSHVRWRHLWNGSIREPCRAAIWQCHVTCKRALLHNEEPAHVRTRRRDEVFRNSAVSKRCWQNLDRITDRITEKRNWKNPKV